MAPTLAPHFQDCQGDVRPDCQTLAPQVFVEVLVKEIVRRGVAVQPPDLTTLAERHGGKFPYDYVARVLRFGPGTAAHGSSDMPTWGPIFQIMDNSDAHAKDRLRNLSDYLGSLQRRQLSRTQSALMIADTRLRDR